MGRIGLGKPQHGGTLTKFDKGKPVIYAVDDSLCLDAHRKELFMRPIGDYLRMDYLVKFYAQTGK